ncbi:MAG: sulfotransferase family 2 domain-containing protein [Pseudomonadota bacterium]
MISHKYRCIFVHIPRTAGSSIEDAICGKNWWSIDPSTKHITAKQAKQIYGEYWDDYFKFAIVRNPWDRCVSLMEFSQVYYGLPKGALTLEHIKGYRKLFGESVTIEYDWRFYSRIDVEDSRHKPRAVYRNILDEPLDFIGKYEDLARAFKTISRSIGLPRDIEIKKVAASKARVPFRDAFQSAELRDAVADLYAGDIEDYGYDF